MTITMTNYGLTWVTADGEPHADAVAYDKPSAERRMTAIGEAGCTNVRIVETRPGTLPDAHARA